MKPVTTGIIAALAIILAFIAGTQVEVDHKGPAEKVGEAIDQMANQPANN